MSAALFTKLHRDVAALDPQIAAAEAALNALYAKRTKLHQKIEKATPVLSRHFTVILEHMKSVRATVPPLERLYFNLTAAERTLRWMAFVRAVINKLVDALPPEKHLGALAKKVLRLMDETEQEATLTQQPWQLGIPLLNYCNDHPKFSDKHRDSARILSAIVHAFEEKWGAVWLFHAFRDAATIIPDYPAFAKERLEFYLNSPSEHEQMV